MNAHIVSVFHITPERPPSPRGPARRDSDAGRQPAVVSPAKTLPTAAPPCCPSTPRGRRSRRCPQGRAAACPSRDPPAERRIPIWTSSHLRSRLAAPAPTGIVLTLAAARDADRRAQAAPASSALAHRRAHRRSPDGSEARCQSSLACSCPFIDDATSTALRARRSSHAHGRASTDLARPAPRPPGSATIARIVLAASPDASWSFVPGAIVVVARADRRLRAPLARGRRVRRGAC